MGDDLRNEQREREAFELGEEAYDDIHDAMLTSLRCMKTYGKLIVFSYAWTLDSGLSEDTVSRAAHQVAREKGWEE